MSSHVFFIHTLSNLHVGCGENGSYIDLPVSRERATRLPNIPGSGIKGTWREVFAQEHPDQVDLLFGPEHSRAGEHAGSLDFTDARLLVMPVASKAGHVAYLSCPFALMRYQRDATHFSQSEGVPAAPAPIIENEVGTTEDCALVNENAVRLEDISLTPDPSSTETVQAWARYFAATLFTDEPWQAHFTARFAIVSDAVFSYFAQLGTELRTRVRIDPATRTVVEGALWSEESLPPETVFYGGLRSSALVAATKKSAPDLSLIKGPKRIQLGGNATVGMGQCLWSTR